MPATSPTRWRSRPCSSIRSHRCFRPMAWDSPTSPPSVRKAWTSLFASTRSSASTPSPKSSPRRRSRRSKGRGSHGRGSRSTPVRNCAMRAPTRPSRFRCRPPRRCAGRSRARTKAVSASSIAQRPSPSRRCRPRRSAARRGSPSGPDKARRKTGVSRRPPPHRPRRLFPPARRASFRTVAGETRISFCVKRLAPAQRSMGRRLSSSRTRRSSSNRAGAPRLRRKIMC